MAEDGNREIPRRHSARVELGSRDHFGTDLHLAGRELVVFHLHHHTRRPAGV